MVFLIEGFPYTLITILTHLMLKIREYKTSTALWFSSVWEIICSQWFSLHWVSLLFLSWDPLRRNTPLPIWSLWGQLDQVNAILKISSYTAQRHTPPEWAIQQPVVSRELVYYILSGTPRSVQKYFCPNLTADFFGDNHFFLICDQNTNQTSQLIGSVDSW